MEKELKIFITVAVFGFITVVFNKFLGFEYAFLTAVTIIYWTLLDIKYKGK